MIAVQTLPRVLTKQDLKGLVHVCVIVFLAFKQILAIFIKVFQRFKVWFPNNLSDRARYNFEDKKTCIYKKRIYLLLKQLTWTIVSITPLRGRGRTGTGSSAILRGGVRTGAAPGLWSATTSHCTRPIGSPGGPVTVNWTNEKHYWHHSKYFYMYDSEDLMLSSMHVKLNNPTIVAYL